MSLANLETVLQRPNIPQDLAKSPDWNAIEAVLRTGLPKDYKAFIEAFGSGVINGFLIVLNPFSSNNNINLLRRGRMEMDGYAASKKSFPDYYVHDVFPSLGGLLPFAVTDNGETLYWNTTGQPDSWSVIAYESRGPKYFQFGGNMTKFLTRLLTRSVECNVLPRSFPSKPPEFVPIRGADL